MGCGIGTHHDMSLIIKWTAPMLYKQRLTTDERMNGNLRLIKPEGLYEVSIKTCGNKYTGVK